jgi:hypothetical protein
LNAEAGDADDEFEFSSHIFFLSGVTFHCLGLSHGSLRWLEYHRL